MKRNNQAPSSNSTHRSRSRREFDTAQSIRSLESRIARLERAFENAAFPLDVAASEIQAEVKKRPGPKPIHFGALLAERDDLIQMLENYWPELEPLCRRPVNGKELRVAFEAIAKQQAGRYAQAATHLAEHRSELVRFIASDRFRHDPRQIANAFAGFPKIGTWRSLKVCQSEPSKYPIGDRAIKHYISRKHPDLLRDLAVCYSLPNFSNSLRKHRSQDRNLHPFQAHFLYECWKKCKPDYAALGVNR